jgi:uncharacterized membrane protein
MRFPVFPGRKAPDCGFGKWQIVLSLGFVWLVVVALSLYMHRDDITTLRFSDPDDTMRLLEVRDFLAGQSWFDVSQHRANPPLGGPMHWSRLVDLPIATVILLLRPFLGTHGAEIGAVLVVPALTLATLLYALYWAVSPLMQQGRALLCCAAFAISPFVFVQCAAMRIDHHAWQAVMMALTMGGVLHPDLRKGGLIAGLAMAVWLQISIEGLAFAALTAAVMAVRYILDAREWPRFTAYLWTMVGASAVLLLATQGWTPFHASQCDSLSSVYLAPIAVAPPLLTMLHRLLAQSTLPGRIRSVTLALAGSIGMFFAIGRQCAAGPFAMLDPIVYKFWYMGISEGLPIWKQDTDTAFMVVIPSLVGMTGYAIACYAEQYLPRRRDWLSLLMLATGATILALLVMRAGFIAHLVAIPGAAWLAVVALKRARAIDTVLLRIPSTIGSLMLLFPIVVIPMTSVAFPGKQGKDTHMRTVLNPVADEEIAALQQLAPSTVFAPIDISPSIMLRTRNAIVGTAHHRNTRGMKLVFDAFLARPEDAKAIVLRSSAMYLAIAPMGETDRYREFAPRGLAAQLLRGQAPDWLSPVRLPGLKVLRVYRIHRDVASSIEQEKTPASDATTESVAPR